MPSKQSTRDSTAKSSPKPQKSQHKSPRTRSERTRITRWGWAGVLWAGVLAALSMPGLGGPSWLIWLAPYGLLAISWQGVRPASLQPENSASSRLRGRWRRLFLLGWLAGLLQFLISLYWLSDIDQAPRAVSLLAWVSLSAYLALYHGLFCLLLAWLLPRSPRLLASFSEAKPTKPKTASRRFPLQDSQDSRPREQWWLPPLLNLGLSLAVALLWAALETLRDWIFGGFNWNGYAAPLIDQVVIAQLADLSGAIALSGLPLFVACLFWGLASRVRFRLKHNLGPRPQLDLLVFALLAALMLQHAFVWLEQRPQGSEIQLKALAIQPLISQQEKWDIDPETGGWNQETIQQTQQTYQNLVEQGQAQAQELEYARLEKDYNGAQFAMGNPRHLDLVLLPESAYSETILKFDGELYFSFSAQTKSGEQVEYVQAPLQMLSELQLRNTSIISGFNLNDRLTGAEPSTLSYNALIQISPDGELSSYQKRHLVPFGEYLPLRPLFPFLHDLLPGNFSSGAENQELVLPLRSSPPGEELLRIAPLICFEDTVPRLARESIRQNPARCLLLNATNDGWFGETAAEQHIANARFRAIELRRPLLRSGNSGGTAAVEVNGTLNDFWEKGRRQVVEQDLNELDQEGVLFARLRIPSSQSPPETLYLRWGNWLGWLGVILIPLLIAFKIKRKAKSKNSA